MNDYRGIRKKLLIVDDSLEIRKGLSRFISEIPSVSIVGEAGDAATALALVEKLNPDFVTLDIKMPGDGGIIALTEIKKRFPHIIVLMLTNFPFDHYRKICRNAGADYFFDKSHEFEEMVGAIKKLADG
jgi:DNA-binding NarL/FixJ family response regulator